MFRILNVINEFRVFCFILKDRVKFFFFVLIKLSWWFLDVLINYYQLLIGKRKGF